MQNNEILAQIADALEQMNKATEALSGILNEKFVSPAENSVPIVYVANSGRRQKRKTVKVCEENPTIVAYVLEDGSRIDVKKYGRVENREYVYYQYEDENGKTTYHRRKINEKANGARYFDHSSGSGDKEKHTLIYMD